VSTDALLSADTAGQTEVPTGQQPADDAGASFDQTPSLSALDQFLNQPIRPELAGVSTTVDSQAPADPALGTQQTVESPVQDLDFTDLIKADPDAERFLTSKYNGDQIQFAKAGIEAMKALSRRDDDAAQWRAYQNQLAQQQRIPPQVQQQAPAEPRVWDAPEFKPEWKQLLGRDAETGKVTGPPEIVAKWEAFQTWAANKNLELLHDPVKTLGPIIDQRAKEIADQRARESLTQYDSLNSARQFLADNQSWLLDQSNPNQLSQYGQVFAREVQTLAARGVPQDLQIELGKRAVNEMYYRQQAEQATLQNQQRVQQQPPARPNAQAAVHSPNAAGPTNVMSLYRPGEDLESAVMRNLGTLGHKLDHFQQ
jgi:hypothetical protein